MSAKSENENGGLGARKGSSETDTVDVASLLVDDDEDPRWEWSVVGQVNSYPSSPLSHKSDPTYSATVHTKKIPKERALDFKPFHSTPERLAKR
jgi:hypothetical protein